MNTAHCLNCLHPQESHTGKAQSCEQNQGGNSCVCKAFVPLTADRVRARVLVLEEDELRYPDKNYFEAWTRLAYMYLLAEGGRFPNYHYCKGRAGKYPDPEDDGHYHDWQEWANK